MTDQTADPAVASRDALKAGVVAVLAATLGLPGGAISARCETPVLGAIPELDSMSVMTFLINLEEAYGITIHDDEVSAAMFQTVGSLTDFLANKLDG